MFNQFFYYLHTLSDEYYGVQIQPSLLSSLFLLDELPMATTTIGYITLGFSTILFSETQNQTPAHLCLH